MIYLIRFIALPFVVIYTFFLLSYFLLINLINKSYSFLMFGVEQIVHYKKIKKSTVLQSYLKNEKAQSNFKTNPTHNCSHIWQEDYGRSSTNAPRKKCVICGVSLNNNFFTH